MLGEGIKVTCKHRLMHGTQFKCMGGNLDGGLCEDYDWGDDQYQCEWSDRTYNGAPPKSKFVTIRLIDDMVINGNIYVGRCKCIKDIMGQDSKFLEVYDELHDYLINKDHIVFIDLRKDLTTP